MRIRAALLILSLCFATAHAQDAERFGAVSRDEFRSRLPVHPYEPARERIEKMSTGARQVTRCMPYTDVRRLMGAPNFGTTTRRPGDPPDKKAGAAWTYIYNPVRSAQDPYLQTLTVWFDSNGKVSALHVRGVAGVDQVWADDKIKCE